MSLLLLFAGASSVAVVPDVPIIGGGWVAHHAGDERRHVNQFTRKRYEEFKAAERALAELEAKAKEEARPKRKKAIDIAIAIAAEAAEEFKNSETGDIAALIQAIEAATAAHRASQMMEQVKLVQEHAKRLMAEIEDDEEAVMLLLHS